MKIMKQRRSKWRPPLSSLQLLLPARKHHAVWNHTIKQRKTRERHNYRHYWSCLVKRFQYWLSILGLLRGVGSLQLVIQRPVDIRTSAETLFLANTFLDSWFASSCDSLSFLKKLLSNRFRIIASALPWARSLFFATWPGRLSVIPVPCFCALCALCLLLLFFFCVCLTVQLLLHIDRHTSGESRVWFVGVMSDHVFHILCLLLLCLLSTI